MNASQQASTDLGSPKRWQTWLESFQNQSSPMTLLDSKCQVQVLTQSQDLPKPWQPDADQVFLVPSFEVLEELASGGIKTARIAVVPEGEQEAWTAVIKDLAPGEAVRPPKPYSFPFRSLVVVPTYNEMENLEAMVKAIRTYADSDILVVDDNSPDGTGQLADELSKRFEGVHVMHRQEKQGLGRAYLAGFHWALEHRYKRILEMDCDFSHAPWDLPRLLHASQDADLVIGSRYAGGGGTEGWVASRRMLSRGANLYTRIFLGFSVNDWTAGYRCYRAALLSSIDLQEIVTNGYSFQIEMTWRSKRTGAKVKELPIHFIDRDLGKSKMSRAIAFEAIKVVPWLRLKG